MSLIYEALKELEETQGEQANSSAAARSPAGGPARGKGPRLLPRAGLAVGATLCVAGIVWTLLPSTDDAHLVELDPAESSDSAVRAAAAPRVDAAPPAPAAGPSDRPQPAAATAVAGAVAPTPHEYATGLAVIAPPAAGPVVTPPPAADATAVAPEAQSNVPLLTAGTPATTALPAISEAIAPQAAVRGAVTAPALAAMDGAGSMTTERPAAPVRPTADAASATQSAAPTPTAEAPATAAAMPAVREAPVAQAARVDAAVTAPAVVAIAAVEGAGSTTNERPVSPVRADASATSATQSAAPPAASPAASRQASAGGQPQPAAMPAKAMALTREASRAAEPGSAAVATAIETVAQSPATAPLPEAAPVRAEAIATGATLLDRQLATRPATVDAPTRPAIARPPAVLDEAALNRARRRIVNLVAQGALDEAEARLDELDAAGAGRSRIGLRLRGYIASQRGDFELAGTIYTALLAENPDDAETRFNAALAAFELKDLPRARRLIEPLLQNDAYRDRVTSLATRIDLARD